MIPSCDICNDIYKKDYYISEESGLRLFYTLLFYNPYFDSFINNEQFLICNLSCEDNYLIINFEISNPYSFEKDEYKILKYHFDKLKLNQRYKEVIVNDLFPEYYNEFVIYDESLNKEIFIDTDIAMLKQVIDGRIRGLRLFNQNYWRKVFWIALKECDECLSLIIEKKITL